MQTTVTNQCGAHYDIAFQLHPLSITAIPEPLQLVTEIGLYGQQLSLYGTNVFSDIEKLNFKVSSSKLPGAISYLTSVSFTRSTTTFSETEISNFNLPTIIFSTIFNILQFKFFTLIFETIARSRAYGGFNPSKSAEPCTFLQPTCHVLLTSTFEIK